MLAQTLMHLSRKGASRYVAFVPLGFTRSNVPRRDTDILLEYEVAKCIRHIFNAPVCLLN